MKRLICLLVLCGLIMALVGCAAPPLIKAARENDVANLQSLLLKGDDINAKNGEWGKTALMEASQAGNIEVVKALLGAGANVNLKDDYDDTALGLAAWKCHPAVVRVLIDNGADVNAQNKEYGSSPLMFATDCDDVASVKLLLLKGADPNARNGKDRAALSALYYASKAGNWEIVRSLLEGGANVRTADKPNAPEKEKIQDFNPNAALSYAAARGIDPIVKLFIEKGIDVNFALHWPSSDDRVPLVIAANKGHTTTVAILLDAGADVNSVMGSHCQSKNNSSRIWLNCTSTALIAAVRKGHKETAAMLINRGADVNLADSDGKTALVYAVDGKHTEIEALLRQASARK